MSKRNYARSAGAKGGQGSNLKGARSVFGSNSAPQELLPDFKSEDLNGIKPCPVCGRVVPIKKDGKVRNHRAGTRTTNWPCPAEQETIA